VVRDLLVRASGRVLKHAGEGESLLLAVAALTLVYLLVLPWTLVQDTWLALVDGRWVALNGIPHTDVLTLWSTGARWVDQQWLAHLLLYGAARLGGLRLVLLLCAAATIAALGGAAFAARRLGASSRYAALLVPAAVLAAPWLVQSRTQSLALPLFVAVYVLLVRDTLRPGRRVLWALPLLILWANVHGSAVLGAGLVTVYGLTLVRQRRVGWALLVAPLCLLATPYGWGMVGYYKLLLWETPLGKYVAEWRPLPLAPITILFLALVALVAFLAVRHHERLALFERLALVLLLVGSVFAARNTVWFVLAAVVTVPKLLDAEWPVRPLKASLRLVNAGLASACGLACLAALVLAFVRSDAWFERTWSPGAASLITQAAAPDGWVLADDLHSDWLLWKRPELAGRIAYDIRFELLSKQQLAALSDFRARRGSDWQRCARRFTVLTFGPRDAKQRQAFAATPGITVIYRTRALTVMTQVPAVAPCPLTR
jgi:hypothetical protein